MQLALHLEYISGQEKPNDNTVDNAKPKEEYAVILE